MIIHINPTLQSYLVPEKKMIIFLKHAGTPSGNVDMNIQWPRSAAQCVPLAQRRDTMIGRLIATRHQLSSALGSLKQCDEKWMALTH